MCAMLVLIAPEELRVSTRRVNRFVDSYIGLSDLSKMPLLRSSLLLHIELLTRRRLYACAAYLRKFCRVAEIGQATLVWFLFTRFRFRE
jgi:hypothetical protein